MTDDELDFENRIVNASYTAGDDEFDTSLRPRRLSDYIGQEKAKENLKVYIEAAKMQRRCARSRTALRPPGARENNTCGNNRLGARR